MSLIVLTFTFKLHSSLLFFILLLLELFLLGSGQFLSFGGFSLRMVFYSIAISSSVILLLMNKGRIVDSGSFDDLTKNNPNFNKSS